MQAYGAAIITFILFCSSLSNWSYFQWSGTDGTSQIACCMQNTLQNIIGRISILKARGIKRQSSCMDLLLFRLD